VQQANLQAQQIEAGIERLQALQQVVEAGDETIAEGKAVIAGQAVEQRHKQLDQIHGGLDDRQFAAAGGGAGVRHGVRDGARGGWRMKMPITLAPWTFP